MPRARTREDLRGSALFTDAPSGCVVVSADGTMILVNPRLCTMFGYSGDELVGRKIEVLVPESLRDAHLTDRVGYDAAPRIGPMGKGRQVIGRHRDGSEIPLDVRLAPTALDGDPCVIAFVDDVTERVQAQSELDQARGLFQAILDHAPSQVYVKDLDGCYLLVNHQIEVASGLGREAMIGRTAAELFPEADLGSRRLAEREVVATGRGTEAEEVFGEPEGRQVYLVHKFPLLSADGAPYAVCGIATNITARKALEAAVDSARTEAERANRAKSHFLSRVSHELRTPLNSVMGFAQLLQMETDDPDVRESAEQILRAGRHLLALINEVLDISRIEAGELRLSVELVRIADVLAEVSDLIRVQADQRGLAFESAVPGELAVLADRHRLIQVLLNLGSNAVKFNRRGGCVAFSVQPRGSCIRIAVRDDGPGLSADARARLFEPFERLDVDPALEGTGLGLALSRGLVEAMGGSIGVESTPGSGATFWVDLPPAEGSEETVDVPDPIPATATILYIDDNPQSVALVERLLMRRPHVRLLTAMQGSIGLDLAAVHDVDLVLVDVHLPDVAGDVVLGRLRAEPKTATVPVVMVSADVSATRARRLRAAGASEVLAKPLELDGFLAMIDELVPIPDAVHDGSRR